MGGALADDSGVLVEVGRALLEDGGVVGGAAAIGEDGGQGGQRHSVGNFGSLKDRMATREGGSE
jgi:hypothetical protein